MDWQFAIRKNRDALAVVVMGLIALARENSFRHPRPSRPIPLILRCERSEPRRGGEWAPQDEDDLFQTFSRPLHRTILRILRPAESALRRLIVVVAAMLSRKAREKRGDDGGANENKGPLPDFSAFNRRDPLPSFTLIDPRKRFDPPARAIGQGTPRISVPGERDAGSPAKPDETVGTAALLRRIRRLQYALHTLPRQARRLNRLMARRAKAEPGPGRIGPIRPGHPPGHRKKPAEPVDDILRNCHWLARTSGFKPP